MRTFTDERRDVVSRMTQITAELEQLGTNATGPEALRFDALTEEYRQLDERRQVLERHIDLDDIRRAAVGGDGSARLEPGSHGDDDGRDQGRSRTEVRALRNIEAAHRSGSLPDHAAEAAEQLVTTGSTVQRSAAAAWADVAGDPHYLSAFAHLVADPTRGHMMWSEAEREAFAAVQRFQSEQRAMSLTDNAGGYMVPLSLDPAVLLTNAGTTSALRQVARKVTTATDQWQGVTSAGATAEWLAEAAEAADGSPTLDDVPIPVHKGSSWVPFTYEVGMDAVNFATEVGKVMRDSVANLEAAAFTTGSGTGQPKGIITALDGSASEVAPTTPETFAAADVYRLIESLPARFRGNAKWMANLTVLNLIDEFETSNGSKRFAELGADKLLRRDVVENSDMDGSWNVAATADNFILLVGDFDHFVIVDRIGTTVELVPHLMGANRRPTGQRGFHAWFRTGSDATTVNAFRVLNLATTA